MLVFNNQQQSGYEEIASYSPRYYRKIKEMDAVFRLAGWLIDFMSRDMENMVAFQFIKYMDEESLTRYEAFLGIMRNFNKTSEERKSYINAMLACSKKISKDSIVAIVNQFAECDCAVTLNGAALEISMTFKDNNDKYMSEIRSLIRANGPSNLKYIFGVQFCFELSNVDSSMALVNISYLIKMPFYPGRSYDGSTRYDGTTHYDAKRNYKLGVGLKLQYRVENPKGGIGNLAVESRRNVQYYNGKKRYDGTTKYNAMIRRDEIE